MLIQDIMLTLTAQKLTRALCMDLRDLDPVTTLDTVLLSGIMETTFTSPHLGISICKTELIFSSFINY